MARAISRGQATPLPPLGQPFKQGKGKSKSKPPKGLKIPKPGTRKKLPQARRKAKAGIKAELKVLKQLSRLAKKEAKYKQGIHKLKRSIRRPWYMRWASKLFGIRKDDRDRVDRGNLREVQKIRDNYVAALYKADQRRTKIEERARARGRRTKRETKELSRIHNFIEWNVNIATTAQDRAKALEQFEPLSGHEQTQYENSLHPPVKAVDVANLQLLETAQTIRYDKPTGVPGQVKSVGREFGGGITKAMRYPARDKQKGKRKGEPVEIELQSVRLAPWLPGKAWDAPSDDVSVHTHPARMWLREHFVKKYGSLYGSSYPELHAPQRMSAKTRAKLEAINRDLASIFLDDVPSGLDIKNMSTHQPNVIITPRRNIVMWRIKGTPMVDRLDRLDNGAIRDIVKNADLEAWKQTATDYPKTLRQARKVAGKYQKVREQLIANRLAHEGVVIKFQKKGEKLRFPVSSPPVAAPVKPTPPPAPPSPPGPLDPGSWDPF